MKCNITLDKDLFGDMPILLLRPTPLVAPVSACKDFLASVRALDRPQVDESMREFLRQWGTPPL